MPLSSRRPIPAMSAKRRAALADQGVTNPMSTFAPRSREPRTPKLATKPSVKRSSANDPTPETVALILERDGFSCASCGDGIGDIRGLDWTVQHRVARGAGGSSRPEINLAANLLILCGGPLIPDTCHNRVEKRGAEDETAGYWVRRDCGGRPTDPAEVPVYHSLHGWVRLGNDGSVTRVVRVAA